MSEPTGVQICEYHGREFVWILFNNGWGRGGKERYSLAQAEEIDGPLKPMDYIGTAPQILADLSWLRQELDEARAERDAAINRYDNLIASAGRTRPRQPDGTCAECGAGTGHRLECREFAIGVLDHARSIVRGDLSVAEAERDRMRPVVEALRPLMEQALRSSAPRTELFQAAINAWVDFRSATPDAEPAPRVWHLPPEPGLEVTRVVDTYGQHFERQHDEHPGDDVWIGQTFAGDDDVDDLVLEWNTLMAYQAPLTDATPEPAPGVPVDTEATP